MALSTNLYLKMFGLLLDLYSLLGEEIEPFDHLELFTSFNQTLMGVHSSKHEVGDLLFLC